MALSMMEATTKKSRVLHGGWHGGFVWHVREPSNHNLQCLKANVHILHEVIGAAWPNFVPYSP
jgi:hypothetical protein